MNGLSSESGLFRIRGPSDTSRKAGYSRVLAQQVLEFLDGGSKAPAEKRMLVWGCGVFLGCERQIVQVLVRQGSSSKKGYVWLMSATR